MIRNIRTIMNIRVHSCRTGIYNDLILTYNLFIQILIEKIDLLKDLVNNDRELMGLNVTIPFKKNVIPLLDEVDSEAGIIGAVNTIKIFRISTDEYSLKGYNTDIYGFETPLLKVLRKHHKNALILGTGGASKAVAFILKKHSIAFHYVSRKPKEQTIFSIGYVSYRQSFILSFSNFSVKYLFEKLCSSGNPISPYFFIRSNFPVFCRRIFQRPI
ncbi:Shikimate dehydrogenase (NADP(+)) [subsurface metagenome]